jgi:outer membrane lipoprotein-sorting protein
MVRYLHSAGISLLLTATVLIAPAARASGSSIVQQMQQALQSVQSYEMSMDLKVSGTATNASTMHVDAIVVRHGTSGAVYVQEKTVAGAQSISAEAVYTGTHTCIRGAGATSWHCQAGTSTLASLLNYPDLTTTLGAHLQPTPIGSKLVRGQRCDGYSIVTSSAASTLRGTMWLAAATKLPVEEEVSESLVLQKGRAPLTSRLQIDVSRYNDPSLHIPTVPAS